LRRESAATEEAARELKEKAMQSIERTTPRFRYEEMNRTRQEIQNKWTEAERSHRRQLAECRQQALLRLLSLMPVDRSRGRQLAEVR
jgi:hypothetical protein